MFLPDQPLQFEPIFRSYIWGGDRLALQLGKKPPGSGIWAESWEIVDHREGESRVSQGPFEGWSLRQLIESFPNELMGYDAPNERFPLLLKYLDCQRVLSVQVHPDDAYGATMATPDRGKTEAWYVIDAEPGAVLYAGLKEGVTKEDLLAAIANGTTQDCLHTLTPTPGQCVFIPAGTIHALGAGLLVAEIQQASDCTFRLFDWNRLDKDGNPRDLHVEQAIEVIDFKRGPVGFVVPTRDGDSPWETLVSCDKFVLSETRSTDEIALPKGKFSIITIPRGSAQIVSRDRTILLNHGDTVLIPAACSKAMLQLNDNSIALMSNLPQ